MAICASIVYILRLCRQPQYESCYALGSNPNWQEKACAFKRTIIIAYWGAQCLQTIEGKKTRVFVWQWGWNCLRVKPTRNEAGFLFSFKARRMRVHHTHVRSTSVSGDTIQSQQTERLRKLLPKLMESLFHKRDVWSNHMRLKFVG